MFGHRALVGAVLLLAALLLAGCSASVRRATPTPVRGRAPAGVAVAPLSPTPAAPQLPADLSLLTLVNKDRGLAASYEPPDLTPIPRQYVSSTASQSLRRAAEEALVRMLDAAGQEGLTIKVNSAYRSYQYQVSVFRNEVATYGCTQALRESAVPGHSEHQLGLAVDLTSPEVRWDLVDAFAQTPEGAWLTAHADAYGFVLSYPKGTEAITGYLYEPWHYRYVTQPVAAAIVASHQTPTEYLAGLESVASSLIVSTTAVAAAAGGCPRV